MNEQQRRAYIEQVFKEIMKLCDYMMRQCEEPKEPTNTLIERERQRLTDKGRGTVIDYSKYAIDVGFLRGPISDDEAKRLLEDAKEHLAEGK